MPTVTSSRDSAAKVAVALAIVVGGVLAGVRAYDGLATTRDVTATASTAAASASYRQVACLDDALRELGPDDTRLFLAIEDPFWNQRTAAAAFPDYPVVATPAEAALVVSISDRSVQDVCAPGFFVSRPGGTP